MRTGVSFPAALAVAIIAAITALVWDPGGGTTSTASGSGRAAAVVPPSNTVPPEVSGTLRDGEVILGLPGLWNGDTPIRFTSRWERCDAERCTATPGRVGFVTRLITADVGWRMRTAVTASNDARSVTVYSRPSAIVKPKLSWITPFPVVALRGLITRRGVYVTRLAARAPRGSTLRVTCIGRGCPYRRATARFRRGVVTARRMHRRTLAFNTVFSLRITHGENRIGKYTRFRVRPRRKPARIDRCLSPDKPSPSPCEPPE